MMGKAYDKNGCPISIGDVLKVFHFVGQRNKRHYMYKQVVEARRFNPDGQEYLLVSHLNLREWDDPDGGYTISQMDQVECDTEIVQSIHDDFNERPKRAA
jgi:hypothetical protein